jgi:hypothetical protein
MNLTQRVVCAASPRRVSLFYAFVICIGIMTACGGGGSSTSTSPSSPSTPSPTLQSITVSPSDPSILAGGNEQYSAAGKFSDGSNQNVTSSVTWTSSNATVATVNTAGLATTLTEGTTTITASLQSITGSTSLTAIPLTVQVSVAAISAAGTLSYQWQTTDGTIQNVNAATTTWTLPDGPGLHFAYVLVSNGVGGYTERRVVVNTDAIGTPLLVAAPIAFTPPTPSATSPVNIFRGFLNGGSVTVGGPGLPPVACPVGGACSFPGAGPFSGIPVSVPDMPLFAESKTTTQFYPMTGASGCSDLSAVSPCTITTNVRGEFVFPNIPPNFFLLSNSPVGQLMGAYPDPTLQPAMYLGLTDAISSYDSPSFNIFVPLSPTNIDGEVLLQDGSPCGTVNEFFGVEVAASATLLGSSGQILAGPVRTNQWGDYDLPYKSGAASVSLNCENAPSISVSVPVSNGATTPLPMETFTVVPPTVTSMTVELNGTQLISPSQFQFLPPTTGVPSDIVPLADAFLAEKGLDSRLGACQYYKAVGAVQTCDAAGNFTGAITFNDWKSQVKIDQYATTPPATALGGGPVYTATYINKEDLNVARNHHSVSNGLPANSNILGQAPYTYVATYVCNHSGPTATKTSPDPLNPIQAEIEDVIQNTVNGQNLIACVTMDYSTFPVPNTAGGNVGYGPYIRFLIFGPSGQLLPSINLDTRREKFVPGTCVVCHGGDYYAGAYPTDGSGSPDVGGHFLPYDEGNFEFSLTQAGLTQAAQEQPIFNLNQNIMNLSNPAAGQGITQAEATLILGWYTQSTGFGPPQNTSSYIDPSWQGHLPNNGINATSIYQNIYAHSCRTCHVALAPQFNFEQYNNLVMINPPQGIVDPGRCLGGTGRDRNRMYKMPNSLITFNQMWGSKVPPSVSTTNPDQITPFLMFFGCQGAAMQP